MSKFLKRLKKSDFVSPRFISKIGQIDSTSFASNANLKNNDRIIAVKGT